MWCNLDGAATAGTLQQACRMMDSTCRHFANVCNCAQYTLIQLDVSSNGRCNTWNSCSFVCTCLSGHVRQSCQEKWCHSIETERQDCLVIHSSGTTIENCFAQLLCIMMQSPDQGSSEWTSWQDVSAHTTGTYSLCVFQSMAPRHHGAFFIAQTSVLIALLDCLCALRQVLSPLVQLMFSISSIWSCLRIFDSFGALLDNSHKSRLFSTTATVFGRMSVRQAFSYVLFFVFLPLGTDSPCSATVISCAILLLRPVRYRLLFPCLAWSANWGMINNLDHTFYRVPHVCLARQVCLLSGACSKKSIWKYVRAVLSAMKAGLVTILSTYTNLFLQDLLFAHWAPTFQFNFVNLISRWQEPLYKCCRCCCRNKCWFLVLCSSWCLYLIQLIAKTSKHFFSSSMLHSPAFSPMDMTRVATFQWRSGPLGHCGLPHWVFCN